METKEINSRLRFNIRLSPLFLVLAVVWLYFSWRHQPISVGYVVACICVGFLCGGLLIMDYNYPRLSFLALLVFIGAPMLLGLFFTKLDVLMGGKISYQYMSGVLVSMLGLVVILRGRIMNRLAQDDVEQIVGPERGRPLFK